MPVAAPVSALSSTRVEVAHNIQSVGRTAADADTPSCSCHRQDILGTPSVRGSESPHNRSWPHPLNASRTTISAAPRLAPPGQLLIRSTIAGARPPRSSHGPSNVTWAAAHLYALIGTCRTPSAENRARVRWRHLRRRRRTNAAHACPAWQPMAVSKAELMWSRCTP
jgi:hypothetical protein